MNRLILAAPCILGSCAQKRKRFEDQCRYTVCCRRCATGHTGQLDHASVSSIFHNRPKVFVGLSLRGCENEITCKQCFATNGLPNHRIKAGLLAAAWIATGFIVRRIHSPDHASRRFVAGGTFPWASRMRKDGAAFGTAVVLWHCCCCWIQATNVEGARARLVWPRLL